MSHDPRGATSPDSNTRAGEMAADDLDRVLFDPLPTPDRFGFDAPGACQGDGPRAGWHGVRRYDGHGPATELLAEIALDGLITRGAAAALRRGAPVVLSIIVPSPAWVRPVEAALRRMSPHPVRCLSRSSPPRPSCATDADSEAADLLARGCPVIALAPDPGWIAPVLVAAADHAVTIPPLDHRQVDRAIRAWCGRRSGTALAPGDLCGLDLPDIAAALRPGSRPAACRARILRASRTRVSPSANHPVTPLAALTGYGDAQAWATRTAGDLARVRRGEASAETLEGVVLFGPPGTGKTTLARALAEAAGVACSETSVGAWFANSPGFLDSIVKQVSQFCDRLELYAKQDGCAIGFIDEIDALPNRSKLDDRNYSWWAPLITYFLTRCESLRKSGVVLIGATNHLDRVDPALLRPGRFDRQFLIAPPDEAGRLGILRNHLGAELERVDLTPAARLSRGMTGAVLAGHVRAARRRATGAGRPMVLDDLMAEIAPAEQRPAAHLRAVALHEAGHALLGHRLGLDVEQVTLQGGVGHAGMTLLRLPDPIPDRAGLERRIVAVLGGRAADSVLGSGPTAGASADLREATRLLAALHGSLGLGATLRAVVDQEHADVLLREDPGLAQLVEGDLRRLQDTAEIMVRADRAAIHRLVKALEADRVVTGGEVAAIAKAHPPRYRIPARVRPRTR